MKEFTVIITAPDEYSAADLAGTLKNLNWKDGIKIERVTLFNCQYSYADHQGILMCCRGNTQYGLCVRPCPEGQD